jgi:UDP-N-acetyl-2-amino-2-deoxyglucuronate dehydrogenase
MSKKIKVLILGAGRVFKHYLFIIEKYKIKNLEIIAVVDKKKLNKDLKKYNFNYFNTINKAMQVEKPDLAIILTPSGMHYQHAKFFLKKKIHVLCEKPLAFFPKQIIELGNLAKKNNILYDVVFQNRFNPALQFAKNLINKNILGKIITSSIRVLWCRFPNYYQDEWHGTWKMDGGVLSQQAIHHLDALNWLIGPVKKVFSIKKTMLNKLEAEDTIVCLFELLDNSICTFQATTAARPNDKIAEITIVGKKGYLTIGGIALNKIVDLEIVNSKNSNTALVKKKNSQKVFSGYGLGHATVLKKTINNLIKKNIAKPLVGYKDASYIQQIIQSIYKSSENKKFYNVKLNNLSKLGR